MIRTLFYLGAAATRAGPYGRSSTMPFFCLRLTPQANSFRRFAAFNNDQEPPGGESFSPRVPTRGIKCA
jgi:hypothetical protein